MRTPHRFHALLLCTLLLSGLLFVLASGPAEGAGRAALARLAKRRLCGAEVLVYSATRTSEGEEASFHLGGNYLADPLTDAAAEARAMVVVHKALSGYPEGLVRAHVRRIVFTDRLVLRYGSDRAVIGAYSDPASRMLVVNARATDLDRAARHSLAHLLLDTHRREWGRYRAEFARISSGYPGPDARTFLFRRVSLGASQETLFLGGYTEEYSVSGPDEDAADLLARLAAGDARFWRVFDAGYRYTRLRRKAELALRFLKTVSGGAVTETRFRALCACPPETKTTRTTVTTMVVTSGISATRRAQLNGWLLDAVDSGDTARVRRLLRNGADPNAHTRAGVTALHLAAHWADDAELLTILLDAGADPNRRDRRGRTPLLELATIENAGEKETLLLIRRGADVNAVDEDGWSALYLAVASGSPDMVKSLVRSKADCRRRLPDGRTLAIFFAETEQTGPAWESIARHLRRAGVPV